jgi:catechol 2,3-dioxygenase-like lactoylglutathione lyase family enzyme
MNKIKIFGLLVNDYDAAIQFYTQKLGFEVVEDVSFGEDRWITLSFPGDHGVALSLQLAKTAEDKALVGKQAGSYPLLGLETLDCYADYNRMKDIGVKFQGEPESGPWGTGVLLDDLYGNKIFMNQEPS